MRTKCIALTNVQAGMITAKPVKDPQGRTLCKEGTPLTERLLSRFNQMQIATLYVESNEALSSDERKQMQDSLAHRFQDVLDDPLLKELHDILQTHLNNLE